MTTSNKFFSVIPPGFEQVALYEWSRLLAANSIALPKYEIFPGGLEYELPTNIGLSLNRYLRIPVRILMRVASFEVTEKEEFVELLKKINWNQFKSLGEVQVSSRSSKLRFKDDLKKIIKKSITLPYQKQGTDVYVRFFRDECTISVDTSGEPLYQRGYNKRVEEAPLRDNLACGLLQFSLQGIEDLSQWEIVDPMAGSGTFLTESYLLSRPSGRRFTFDHWQQEIKDLKIPYNKPAALRAYDKDKKAIATIEYNLKALKAENYLRQQQDILQVTEADKSRSKRLVISNPPYGKRLALKDKDFFNKMYEQIIAVYKPDRLGLIVPKGQKITSDKYELVRFLTFENMGLPVQFRLYVR